jgi:hypothetical protein
VVDWLGSIGEAYLQYSTAFIAEGINGEELFELEAGDLTDFGVSNQRHVKRILKEIQKLAP